MVHVDAQAVFHEMRMCQIAISAACAKQPGGWRKDVVRSRRALSELIGQLAHAVEQQDAAMRSAFSALRAALADHQASWPATTLDPDHASYRKSVREVRDAFDRLETVIGRYGISPGRRETGDVQT